MIRKLPATAAALGAVVVLSLTACSSSSSKADVSPNAPANQLSLKVGFLEATGGGFAHPTQPAAAKAAQDYIRSHLGVNIDSVDCVVDGTPAAAVNCAHKFVAQNVDVVLDGGDLTGAQQPILDEAGIPTLGIVAQNNTVDHSANDFYFGPPIEAFGTGPLEYFKSLGKKTVALTALNNPSTVQFGNELQNTISKQLGLQMRVTFFNPESVNWNVIATTLSQNDPQVIGTIGGAESACTALLKALRTLDVKGDVFMGSCSDFRTEVPAAQAAGVLAYTALWQLPMEAAAPADIKAQLKIVKDATSSEGKAVTDQYGTLAFAEYMDAAKVAKSINGTVNAASMMQQLRSLKDFDAFLTPSATCDGNQYPGTSSCIKSLLITKITPTGEVALAGGQPQPVKPAKAY